MAKQNRKRWTSSEDSIVQDAVMRNPSNLQESFKTAEKSLKNRTSVAIMRRWYKKLKFGKKIFFIETNSVRLPGNTKNTFR